MTFTLSGSIITQSGTDTNLSGLSGIAGVATIVYGTKTIYSVGNLKISVTGTLTQNPAVEVLVFGPSSPANWIDIQANGTFNLGVEAVEFDVTRYSFGDAIIAPRSDLNTFAINGLTVRSGGTFNWRGGSIISGLSIGVLAGGTINVFSGRLVNTHPVESATLRNEGSASDMVVAGLELDSVNANPASFFALAGINNFSARFIRGRVQQRAGTNEPVILKNIQTAQNSLSHDYFAGATVPAGDTAQAAEISNVDRGTAYRFDTLGLASRTGHIAIFQEIRFTIDNKGIASPENGIVYIPTTNSGNRTNPGTSKFRAYRDFTGSTFNSYISTINSLKQSSTLTVLTGRLWDGSQSSATLTVDLYSKSQVRGADDFTAYFISYHYQLTAQDLILKSSSTIGQTIASLPDTSIVQTNPTTVAAYTGYAINTGTNTITLTDSGLNGGRTYDWFKLWKVNNFALEYPTVSSLVCAKDGTTLDFGDLDIVVDGVTFASHATVNKIKTTGTIDFINSADYNVIVEDSTGIRYPALTFTGFPTSNNANGIAPAPKVGLVNLRTSDSETYMVGGSSIAIKLSDVNALTDDDVRVTFDAIGYIRPLDQTIKGNRTEPVSVVFEEITNSEGTPIVGLAAAADIEVNLIDERLLLPNSTSFYGALMRWENVTAGSDFLLFPTDAVRRFQFVEDRLGRYVVIDPSWSIAAKPDATQSPIILDFVVQKFDVSGDPVDPFEHGLDSTAPGLTDRPEVVLAFQAPATEVRVSSIADGAITAASIAANAITAGKIDADAIGASELATSAVDEIRSGLATAQNVTDSQGVITTAIGQIPTNPLLTNDARLNNLDEPISTRSTPAQITSAQNAITTAIGALNNLSAAQVWAHSSRSLTTFGTLIADTVSAIWGAATRSLTDKANFTLASSEHTAIANASSSAVWSAATRTLTAIDKTGYSLTPAERTAIAVAVEAALINEGDGQQLIDAILDVINSNLDLPALELAAIAQAVRTELTTELARIDATISSRSTQSSVNAIPTNPVLTTDARLNNLDAAVSTRSTFNRTTETVTVGAINANTINAAAIANDAITSAKIATDAIGSDELAATAITEIRSGLATTQNVTDAQNTITTAIGNIPSTDLTPVLTAIDALPTASEIDTQLSDNFAAVLSAIAALPNNTTAIAQILDIVDNLTFTGGNVNATIGNQTVTLSPTDSDRLLRIFQREGFDPANPVDVSQASVTVAGITIAQTQVNSTTVRLQRQP